MVEQAAGGRPSLLKRVATLTKHHQADLDPALPARVTQFEQEYPDAREAQGESKGEVQDDSKQEKKRRKAAARQLKLNLLDQIKLHNDKPERVCALYGPRIFTPRRPDKSEAEGQ